MKVKKYDYKKQENKVEFVGEVEVEFDHDLFTEPVMIDLSENNNVSTFIVNKKDVNTLIDIDNKSSQLFFDNYETEPSLSGFDYFFNLVEQYNIVVEFVYDFKQIDK